MLSAGGRIKYHCPKCDSLEITHCIVAGHQSSYFCKTCSCYGPWKDRIKRRVTVTGELSYWNPDGLLRARNYEDDQNMVLRNAYYHLVTKNSAVYRDSMMAIRKMKAADNRYAQHPYTTPDLDIASHDEMTAILYFYSLYGVSELASSIKIGYYIKYYQIIFHLLACKYQSNIFSFFSSIYLLLSTFIKNPNDTDGELLAILKIQTMHNYGLHPFFSKRILNRIAKNWGDDYYKNLIDSMLWYAPEHPLRVVVGISRTV